MLDAFAPLVTTFLIFGGCCTNVFALEGIVKSEPSSGLIITFLQFVFTAGCAYLTQADFTQPYTVRRPNVPIVRWAFIATLFYSINMLNNYAFAFKISVPVHIILRSFGSVTTMCAGVLRGKRYSKLQVVSVMLLTVGVLVSAWADSESKGKSMAVGSEASTSEFATGLAILLLAQLLAAYQGAYTEDTYAKYKADWTENLFYSHFMSLALFLPVASTLRNQWARLASTPPVQLRNSLIPLISNHTSGSEKVILTSADSITTTLVIRVIEAASYWVEGMPQGLLFLAINAVTQLSCISGVSLLAAKSSAVTVTIVLNIRKLVSFILSTLLFGHQLNAKMVVGASLVFGSGALYGWETSWRLPRERRRKAQLQQSNPNVIKGNGLTHKKE